MPKYLINSFYPKGAPMPEHPTKDEVRERLTEVVVYDHGHDEIFGAYVSCDEKPRDFPEYSAYWVEI